MKQWNGRKKVMMGFISFLLFMWMCTLISKSVYASALPRVTVKKPEKKYIEHLVEAEGMVRAGGEKAIHVESGLRVNDIFVHTGDVIESGTELFRVDTEDLKEVMKEKELEIAELDYYISDINRNKELEESRKQLELARASEDYEAAQKRANQLVNRADATKTEAEEDLSKHNNSQPYVTPDEAREDAWNKYNEWVAKEERLVKAVEDAIALVTLLETPNEDGTDKSSEQNEEIDAAKETLEQAREELAAHESQKLLKPDFSAEDEAKKSWESGKTELERGVEQAGYGQEDAYLNREDSLRSEQRKIEDANLAEKMDSTLSIYKMKRQQKADELEIYKEILNQEGVICSSFEGTVTDIGIKVGDRTPDAGSIICADHSIPYQFSTSIDKEQKKYINQGDEITLIFPKEGDGKHEVTAYVDYLAESELAPGTYEIIVYLPDGEGRIGMSGTLSKKYSGESQNYCIPIDALIRENQSTYVYIAAVRDGILGEELYAERVSVSVKDENDKFAALEEGALTNDTEIIISATEDYSKGSVIRYE